MQIPTEADLVAIESQPSPNAPRANTEHAGAPAEREKLERKISKLTSRMAELAQEAKQRESNLDSLRASSQNLSTQLESELRNRERFDVEMTELRASKESVAKLAKRVSAEKEELLLRIKELEDVASRTAKERDEAQTESQANASAASALGEAHTTIEQLKEQVGQLDTSTTALKTNAEADQKNRSRAEREIVGLKKAHETTEAELTSLRSTLSKAQHQIEQARTLEDERKGIAAKMDKIETICDTLRKENLQLHEEMKQRESHFLGVIKDKNTVLDEKGQANKALTAELENLRDGQEGEETTLLADIDHLKEELHQAHTARDQVLEKLKEEQAAKQEQSYQAHDLQRQLRHSQKEVDRLSRMSTQTSTLEKENIQLIELLKGKIKKLERDIKRKSTPDEVVEKLRDANERLHQELKTAKESVAVTRFESLHELDRLKSSWEEQRTLAESKEQQAHEALRDSEEAKRALRQLQIEHRTLREVVDELKSATPTPTPAAQTPSEAPISEPNDQLFEQLSFLQQELHRLRAEQHGFKDDMNQRIHELEREKSSLAKQLQSKQTDPLDTDDADYDEQIADRKVLVRKEQLELENESLRAKLRLITRQAELDDDPRPPESGLFSEWAKNSGHLPRRKHSNR